MFKKILSTVMLVSSVSAVAASNDFSIDLQCTLNDGTTMELSHAPDTVYVAFKDPKANPESEGGLIKLDVKSGEAQPIVGKQEMGNIRNQYFVLRGTSEDFEGAIAVSYSVSNGVKSAYYSKMNGLGNETEHYDCKPDTIKVVKGLLTNGLTGINKTVSHSN